MAASDWQQIKVLLADALEEPPHERASFLQRSCGGNTTLMREVQALLAQDTTALEEAAVGRETEWDRDGSRIGERIGAYQVLREIGRGGMGAVYLAERADGEFEKQVAVKLLKRGTDTDEILRRFRAERRILARLDHPNIAHLLDAGTTADGLPYFVMEYIAGEPITDYARNNHLSIADRLALFLKVCGAVEAAHASHVIHRDLKPSNILVRPDGEPKLLDFGIAKLLDVPEESVLITLTEQRRLTPACASPEQARGEAITPASDVYALGALLYELLTDRSPHRFSTQHPSTAELARVIGEQQPTRPSLSIHDNAIRRQLRGDLDNIVLTALRKEPVRRYHSVAEFSEDIRRHMEGRAIRARPNTAGYLAARFITRHKQPIGALLAIALVALAFLLFYHPRTDPRNEIAKPNFIQIPEKSIAVLPFEGLSDDKSSTYFVDGIQEGILANLGKIAGLKVTGPASAAHYRGAGKNLREIASTLQVAHVLEGKVEKAGGRVRIYARLVDTRNGEELWAEQYDREVGELFAVQSDIAKAVLARLNATVTPQEQSTLLNKPTKDMIAYDLYLQGREIHRNAFNGIGEMTRAIVLLDEATHRDPEFVAALCLLALSHLDLYWLNLDHTPTRLRLAQAAIEAAAKVQPDAGEVHFARGVFHYWGSRNYNSALAELDLARHALPNESDVLCIIASIHKRQGHWGDARRIYEEGIALDPLNAGNVRDLARSIYFSTRHYAEAADVLDKLLTWRPNDFSIERERAFVDMDWKADLRRLQNLVASDAARAADPNLLASVRLKLALDQREYHEAERALADYRLEDFTAGGFIVPRQWYEGVVARGIGDSSAALAAFNLARERVLATVRARPDDAKALTMLAQIDAALGRKDEAIKEGEGATELLPVSKDAPDGATMLRNLAGIYCTLGEKEKALEQLESLTRLPNGPSYGDLALDLEWDGLRSDPRFSAILAKVKLPMEPMPNGSELSAREPNALNPPTKDLVAYDLFLRGQALIDDIATSTDWEGDNRRAIDLLERAVTHDPSFALAYAVLCRLHLNLYAWVDGSDTRLAEAKTALAEAVRLAPDGVETHISEAQMASATGDCNRALERLRLAQRERPNDALILERLGGAEECVGMWPEGLRDVERAKQLAPGNSDIPNQLKEMYAFARDYRNSDRICDEAIAQFPNGPNYYRAQKVANSLWRGDPKQARARLAEIPEKWDPSGYRSLLALEISFQERDFDRFTGELAQTPWEHFIDEMKLRADFLRALVAEQQGNGAVVESILGPIRKKVAAPQAEASHRSLSPVPRRSAKLARIDSYCGRVEDALRESEEAVTQASSPVDAAAQEIIRAEVLMRAGQSNGALDLLERLATVPYGPSYGELLSLRWDRLRGDPRFQRIVEQLRRRLD